MKKLIFAHLVLFAVGVLTNCGGKKQATNVEEYGTPKESSSEVVPQDIIAQGKQLVDASDCKICHHATNTIIGPSHTDVAKKYAFTKENVDLLVVRIIKGGSGVWGEIPMTGHPDISLDDAKKMARYVLSLDGEVEK